MRMWCWSWASRIGSSIRVKVGNKCRVVVLCDDRIDAKERLSTCFEAWIRLTIGLVAADLSRRTGLRLCVGGVDTEPMTSYSAHHPPNSLRFAAIVYTTQLHSYQDAISKVPKARGEAASTWCKWTGIAQCRNLTSVALQNCLANVLHRYSAPISGNSRYQFCQHRHNSAWLVMNT